MAIDKEKQAYYEAVFGKEKAAEIIASQEDKAKYLATIGVEFKNFTTREEAKDTSADKEATAHAADNLTALTSDIILDVAALTERQAVLSKELNALRGQLVAQEKAHSDKVSALEADNKALRAELALTPSGRASDSSATEVNDKELAKKIGEKENEERDSFWNFALDGSKK